MGKLLVLILIGYVIYTLLRKKSSGTIGGEHAEASREEIHQDPVCGIYIAEGDAVIGKKDGERLFFCSMACLEKYREQLAQATMTPDNRPVP